MTGDNGALEELLQQMHPQAVSLATRILRDGELARDAAQNALIKVYRNMASVRHATAFSSWFNRIVTNEAYLALRV